MFSVSDIESIPAEMKEHDIFCCWKEEMRNGKKAKVPYNARTGSSASPNDLSTFSSYEDAVKVMDDYTGIGFIVSHDICAIDLDDCVNEAGENIINTKHFLQLVKKHTEISTINPELIREFVDKIIVYQAEKVDGKQEQRIKIYYNCIGAIEIEPNAKMQTS